MGKFYKDYYIAYLMADKKARQTHKWYRIKGKIITGYAKICIRNRHQKMPYIPLIFDG